MLARTTSVDDTRALAAALAEALRPRDLVVLTGEMGAGKTAFTQGLGRALGIEGRITSPTFTIAQTYEGGRIRLHHVDVYRLNHLHEALDVGLAEMLDEDAVVVIEWGDAVRAVLPPEYLEIRITFGPSPGAAAAGAAATTAGSAAATAGSAATPVDPAATTTGAEVASAGADPSDPDERRWELRPVGTRWKARTDGLRAILGPWEEAAC